MSNSRPVSQEMSEASTCVANTSVSERSDQDTSTRYSIDMASSPGVAADDIGPISQMAEAMFETTAEYLQGELAGTLDEYKLLEEMNRVTITKYSDMKQIAANVSKSMKDLNEKYKSLQPYLEQIEQIEASALKLEQAAYKLDMYSKRLEAKFKQMEKR